MKLQIKNSDGSVVLYPVSEPTPRAGFTIVEVDEAIQSVIDAGGPFRWVWTDPEDLSAGGTLTKVDRPAPPVPQSVTPRQIRLALIDRGIMPDSITAQLSATEDPVLRAKSLAEWEFASDVKRNHPLIAQLSGALQFTDADVDAIFREAKAIGA